MKKILLGLAAALALAAFTTPAHAEGDADKPADAKPAKGKKGKKGKKDAGGDAAGGDAAGGDATKKKLVFFVLKFWKPPVGNGRGFSLSCGQA